MKKNMSDPEYGKINEEEIIKKNFPKLVESIITSFPSRGRLLDWLKYKFPAIIFTIFMLFETLNFATDCRY